MEDLTKQQIVLLTLFVSFVTSLATGIITVSLMDQAPVSMTQTINRVVERTIERVVSEAPSGTQPAAVIEQPSLAETAEKVAAGTLRIMIKNASSTDALGEGATGLGLILSREGLIVTDKSALGLIDGTEGVSGYVAITSDGREFPIQVVQAEVSGDIVFAALIASPSTSFDPVTWSSDSSSIKLGEAVYALSGSNLRSLEPGIVKKLGATPSDPIETSIDPATLLVGSPLFGADGHVIAFKTSSLRKGTEFYPLSPLRDIAPRLSR